MINQTLGNKICDHNNIDMNNGWIMFVKRQHFQVKFMTHQSLQWLMTQPIITVYSIQSLILPIQRPKTHQIPSIHSTKIDGDYSKIQIKST